MLGHHTSERLTYNGGHSQASTRIWYILTVRGVWYKSVALHAELPMGQGLVPRRITNTAHRRPTLAGQEVTVFTAKLNEHG